MPTKKLPQGVDYLETVLEKQGVLILGKTEIKTALYAFRVWLNQNRDSAEACRFEICDDCKATIKVIDELLGRLEKPLENNPVEEQEKKKP